MTKQELIEQRMEEFYKEFNLLTNALTYEQIDHIKGFIEQSLNKIAEATVEAVRLEPIETAERIVIDYANTTGRESDMRAFVRESAIKVISEQQEKINSYM